MADSQTLKRRKKSRKFPVESAVEVSTLAINQHKRSRQGALKETGAKSEGRSTQKVDEIEETDHPEKEKWVEEEEEEEEEEEDNDDDDDDDDDAPGIMESHCDAQEWWEGPPSFFERRRTDSRKRYGMLTTCDSSGFVGRIAKRDFGGIISYGKVIGWLPPEGRGDRVLYHLLHGDGDEEDLDRAECRNAVIQAQKVCFSAQQRSASKPINNVKSSSTDALGETIDTAISEHINKSKLLGVYEHPRSLKWAAWISKGDIREHLGYFDSKFEAACKYDERAESLSMPVNFAPGTDAYSLRMEVRRPEVEAMSSTFNLSSDSVHSDESSTGTAASADLELFDKEFGGIDDVTMEEARQALREIEEDEEDENDGECTWEEYRHYGEEKETFDSDTNDPDDDVIDTWGLQLEDDEDSEDDHDEEDEDEDEEEETEEEDDGDYHEDDYDNDEKIEKGNDGRCIRGALCPSPKPGETHIESTDQGLPSSEIDKVISSAIYSLAMKVKASLVAIKKPCDAEWKTFVCPDFKCTKKYTQRRSCGRHIKLLCIPYQEFEKRYLGWGSSNAIAPAVHSTVLGMLAAKRNNSTNPDRKPFFCPDFKCRKTYSQQRTCSNHRRLRCITYEELVKRYEFEITQYEHSELEITTSGKWKAQYRTSSGHSVLLGLYDTKEDALQKVQSVQGNSSSGLASAMNNSSSGVTPAQPPPVPPPLKVTANAIRYSQTVAHVGGGGSSGQKRSHSTAMGKSGGKAAPIFKMPPTKKANEWKPFNCPERSCSKLYTHQRKCANHPDLMCITYAELRQRYMAEAMKESSSSSEESDDEEDEEEDDEEDEEEDDEEIGDKATGSSEGNKKAAAAVVAETGIGEISSNGPSSSSSTQSMGPLDPNCAACCGRHRAHTCGRKRGPALSDNVCSNISSCKSAGSFVKRDSTSGKWKAQYRTSSGHSVLLGLYDTKEDALQKVQSVQGNSSSGLASAMNNSSSSNSSSSNISNSALPDCRYVQLSQPQRKAISVEIRRHPERGIFGFHINEVSYHDGAMAVVVTRQDRSICNAFQEGDHLISISTKSDCIGSPCSPLLQRSEVTHINCLTDAIKVLSCADPKIPLIVTVSRKLPENGEIDNGLL